MSLICALTVHTHLAAGIDLTNPLQDAIRHLWDALTAGLLHAMQGATDALLGPMTQTQDPGAIGEVRRMQGVLRDVATEAFGVLFGLAVLWCVQPRFFGDLEQGVGLLWRALVVMATLRSLPVLLGLWFDVVNGIAAAVGHANALNFGHTAWVLVLAPLLFVLAALQRAAALYALAFFDVTAPLAVVLCIYPPTRRIAIAWCCAFANLSLLGVAYSVMFQMVAALTDTQSGPWGDVMIVGGLLAVNLVPGLLAVLTSAEVRLGSNGIGALARFAATRGVSGGS